MYAVLKAHIEIGDYQFNQVSSVKIDKSVDMLSDTAEIQIPSSFLVSTYGKGFENLDTTKTIKVGDPVSISLGYNGIQFESEFKGFVKKVKQTVPVEIECEDAIYLVRQKTLNKLYLNIQLRDLIGEIVQGTGVKVSSEIPDLLLEKFLLKNVNGAKALAKLKDEFGLNIYIDDQGKLFAGLKQQINAISTAKYESGINVIENNLEFMNKEDVRLRIKVVGIAPDNSRIEVEAGDTEGEQRTYHYYNVQSKADLKSIAESKLMEQQYDGYRGSITSFLYPYCNRGWSADISDPKYPGQDGRYFVQKTTVEFGDSGARRILELGVRL